ncbi:ornithine cyclodeaminase family protein [Natronorubrum aibiense]|uniref:Alanine dehydrogenase n=1 Tax=Natronorubrum aibiense TaxID=348826 RepID=A0A5P9P8U2_9EURY|nr:ornithine cyclodeaminase family protein [Natronorubrum aibiense]QFU84528.1 ornithine cyclodeaminase family protein [Natronorubrum aibiense]
MQTLLLSKEDVRENAEMADVIPAVREAFESYERGMAQMPAKSYIDLKQYNGDFRAMPAYLDTGDWDAAGLKWVNVHPDNSEKYGLPTVMGTMIYSDPETAVPISLMDGTELTMKRTGAAAAVATDELAIRDATTLGIVGAGIQSYTQVEAISEIRPIEEIVVSDLEETRTKQFIDHFADRFSVSAGDVSDAASCDVLSTVTPVRDPIVTLDDLGDHTHVNAMGADAEGKQELTNEVLLNAKITIDDHAQTTHSGEINVPYSDGTITDNDIYADLGEIIVGTKDGRTSDDGITVFDSTGLAIQDVATAHIAYHAAKENGNGTEFDLLGFANSQPAR